MPWAEARNALDALLRNPDADLRQAALTALIGTARYDPTRLNDVLQLVLERRNERDPVHATMLRALGNLPASRWQAAHLPLLDHVLQAALGNADCSDYTARMAEQMVLMLLPWHSEWSTQWLAALARERGQLNSYAPALETRLTDAQVRQLAPALLPVLQAWRQREQDAAILHVARMLGQRLQVYPAMIDLLEHMTSDPRAWVAEQALSIIARQQYKRLDTLLPTLLQDDPSWASRSVIYTYLHRRRQDLLTPFLGQNAYKGRFATGNTRFVLPIRRDMGRWTPAQQTRFAATLSEVLADLERDIPTQVQAIYQFAALPTVDPAPLIRLADMSNTNTAIRDSALRALGQLDSGQGVATLLASLNDERARIAIYALRRSLVRMPLTQALELLRAVPMARVTVAKEVVRLIGELPGNAAYAALQNLAASDLHRDVRVALLRAFWNHLETPETWPILERAAQTPDPAIATGVIRIPTDRISPYALRQLARLLASLLVHPDPVVRLDTLERCAQAPIYDSERALIVPIVMALNTNLPDQTTAAAAALFATYGGRDPDVLRDALRQLLPNRQALSITLNTLQYQLRWNRSRIQAGIQDALTVLNSDPLTVAFQIQLAISAFLWAAATAILQRLAAEDMLHADVLHTAIDALNEYSYAANSADLEQFERTFGSNTDAQLRRIGLATLITLANHHGWDTNRRDRLEQYRADSAPLVAAAAQFIFPPDADE